MWIRLYRVTQATWKRFRRGVEDRRRRQIELESVLLALPNDEAKKQALLQFQASFISQPKPHPGALKPPAPPTAPGSPTEIQPNTDPVPDPGPTTPCTPFPPEARVSDISEYMSPPSSYKVIVRTTSRTLETPTPEQQITHVLTSRQHHVGGFRTVATGDEDP